MYRIKNYKIYRNIIIHPILLSNRSAPIALGDLKIKCCTCTVARPTDKIKTRIVRCYL